MDIIESKILLKDFQKGKIEKDKLEHYRGSYKMGYFYTVDIQEAIETVLSELEKKDKIIDLMAEFINKFDLDESICKDIKCKNDVTKQDCINCIKKYFFDTKKNIF